MSAKRGAVECTAAAAAGVDQNDATHVTHTVSFGLDASVAQEQLQYRDSRYNHRMRLEK